MSAEILMRPNWRLIRGASFFIVVGIWLLYQAWRGIVPSSQVLSGKNEAGQRMALGQRVIFALGGALIIGVGILGLFLPK